MPLDGMTLSIGDVCFRLVAANTKQLHSPPPSAAAARNNDRNNDSSTPIPSCSSLLSSLSQPPSSAPQSPLTQHIFGRVRAMKYEIESRRQLLLQQQRQGGGEDYSTTADGETRRYSFGSRQHFFSPNNYDDDNNYTYKDDDDDDDDSNGVDFVDDNNNNNNNNDDDDDIIVDNNDETNRNYYCVNLRSFTGTLRVYSRSQSSSQQGGGNTFMPSSAVAKQRNSMTQSSATATPTRIRNAIDKDILVMNDRRQLDDDGDNNIEVVLEQDRGNHTCNKASADADHDALDNVSRNRRRSVRFSLPPGQKEKAGDDDSVLHKLHKNGEDVVLPPPPQPSYSSPPPTSGISPQQQPPKKIRMSFALHSPPLFSYASPPRNPAAKAKNIARETSTLLARSSRHVLRQVTLAGKDAYDIVVLNGEDRKGGSTASSVRYSILSSAKKRGSSSLEGDDDDDDDDDDDEHDNAQNTGTELHHACASHGLSRIRTLLLNGNGSAGGGTTIDDLRKCDRKGRLPLHIFVNNRSLIESDPKGCEEVVLEMIDCMGGPDVIVRNADALSSCGLIPFVYVLGSWVDKLHRGASMTMTTTIPLGGGRASCLNDKSRVELDSAAAQSSEDGNSKPSSSSSSSSSSTEKLSSNSPSRRRVTYRSLLPSSSSSANDALSKLQYIPSSVAISSHERWAVRILSRLIDQHVETTREAILTNVASVPLFLKSVLLIDDTEAMTEVLNSSLVRHVVVDKRSMNVWLCAMLTNTKEVKVRAVTFLKLLSRLTLADLASSSQSPDRFSAKEMERFTMLQEETFNAVYVMPGFVPAVLELGGLTIENISTTRVMRYITDRTIRKESVFFVLILDFFYSLFLLMGYRLNVEFILFYEDVNGPEYYNEHTYISTSIRGIAGYFFIKEGLTLLSLYMTSTKLAKRYCMSVFNIIDFASVAMLLLTEGALTTNPNLIDNEGFAASITVILLWLKLMGAFKILNSAFALFLFAVDEVMKKIKWFLLFLFMITFMFSDAARTIVAARGDCNGKLDLDMYLMKEFCSDELFSIIIRMYSVVVGDVNLQDFKSSNAMVAVFVLFTFFSIIIILNILIAIIIDSYQGSKKRSNQIFNRARIEYAAHLLARKQFLTPKERPDFHVATYVPQWMRQLLRSLYVLVVVVALLTAEYGLYGAVVFLTYEQRDDYSMIRSVVIVYACVGAIFNMYIFSVATIALFSAYVQRKESLKLVKAVVRCLEESVTLFHGLLGFNADRTVDPVDQRIDLSEEYLKSINKNASSSASKPP